MLIFRCFESGILHGRDMNEEWRQQLSCNDTPAVRLLPGTIVLPPFSPRVATVVIDEEVRFTHIEVFISHKHPFFEDATQAWHCESVSELDARYCGITSHAIPTMSVKRRYMFHPPLNSILDANIWIPSGETMFAAKGDNDPILFIMLLFLSTLLLLLWIWHNCCDNLVWFSSTLTFVVGSTPTHQRIVHHFLNRITQVRDNKRRYEWFLKCLLLTLFCDS